MKRYLLSIVQPDGPPPPDVDLARVMQDVGAFLTETKAAGAWVFNGGLHSPHTATVVRISDDEVLMTDGPFAEAKEHIGGLVVVRAADLDGAVAWAAKLSRATKLPIEVRPFADEAEG
jgi:hypothetical protein